MSRLFVLVKHRANEQTKSMIGHFLFYFEQGTILSQAQDTLGAIYLQKKCGCVEVVFLQIDQKQCLFDQREKKGHTKKETLAPSHGTDPWEPGGKKPRQKSRGKQDALWRSQLETEPKILPATAGLRRSQRRWVWNPFLASSWCEFLQWLRTVSL